ncbi:hypothetical protein JOQ06_012157 [Pogonophryne albipinna]|uniref:Uncharacterized protein n=1 Tax=Pogonophryne albipinna TaxID=1090488 RepID=A0AAD6FQI1_9TELE|nr:hypothetical protein JOQ06_012157 [Pogonophryne albipinna]
MKLSWFKYCFRFDLVESKETFLEMPQRLPSFSYPSGSASMRGIYQGLPSKAVDHKAGLHCGISSCRVFIGLFYLKAPDGSHSGQQILFLPYIDLYTAYFHGLHLSLNGQSRTGSCLGPVLTERRRGGERGGLAKGFVQRQMIPQMPQPSRPFQLHSPASPQPLLVTLSKQIKDHTIRRGQTLGPIQQCGPKAYNTWAQTEKDREKGKRKKSVGPSVS